MAWRHGLAWNEVCTVQDGRCCRERPPPRVWPALCSVVQQFREQCSSLKGGWMCGWHAIPRTTGTSRHHTTRTDPSHGLVETKQAEPGSDASAARSNQRADTINSDKPCSLPAIVNGSCAGMVGSNKRLRSQCRHLHRLPSYGANYIDNKYIVSAARVY